MARSRTGLPATAAVTQTPRRRPRRGRGGARRRWTFYLALAVGVPLLAVAAVTVYYYISFSRMIDARIQGEFQRADPRVFGRPFEVRRGQSLSPRQLVERLNDLGYAQRTKAEQPGEFAIGRDTILVVPRSGEAKGRVSRIHFAPAAAGAEPATIGYIEAADGGRSHQLELDTPLITALVTSAREKRRDVPLAQIPPRMVQAVLAIEDRRFYDHPGVDPIAIVGVVFDYVVGNKGLRGGSTLTQQLVKNTFLTQERTARRKFKEWLLSIALERRLTKDQVLELYLNDVWLGQRGSFAIHGVPEASRIFFGKDIANVSLSEAATIAGVIQSPPRHSPFNNPERSTERRNVVLKAMVDAGYVTADAAARASREPLHVAARSLENEAPYFVDYVGQELQDTYKLSGAVDVYTTLDVHLQKLAQDAVRDGLEPRGRDPRPPQAPARPGGARRDRSAHGRDPRARRRPQLQPVPVQPRDPREPAARLRLQAVRLPRGVRACGERGAERHHARVGRHGRTDHVGVQPADLDPRQLRRRVRRPDHAAPRPRALAQHRHDQGGRDRRLRRGRGALAARGRRHAAAAVSVDRARGLRGDAAAGGRARTRSSPTAARCGRCARSRAS